jgi:hypothetical protein
MLSQLQSGSRTSTNPNNSHVFYILPVTTLRTIDLEGKKISDPLFSRFCEETRFFFGGISAPVSVQIGVTAEQTYEGSTTPNIGWEGGHPNH